MLDYPSDQEIELREARSEIKRHHELIIELKECLEWALNKYEDADGTGVDQKMYEIRKWLNRNIG